MLPLEAVVRGFEDRVPGEFHLLSSIVFDYGIVAVSGIGYLDIDTVSGRFKVACLNHLGVKFFEFEGDRSGITSRYVIEPLARQGNITGVVAEDIKRIYLDLVPSPEATRLYRGKKTASCSGSGREKVRWNTSSAARG